jgi:hypothetical protein
VGSCVGPGRAGAGSTSLSTRSPLWQAKRRPQGHPCPYSALRLASTKDPEGARREGNQGDRAGEWHLVYYLR